MKKLYLSIIFFLPLLSLAQPTIHQSDEPIINLYWGSAIDPNYSAPVQAGGSNVTWNYTNLQWVDTGGAHFVDVEGTPFQATFANANLTVHDVVKNEWSYWHTTPTGVYVSGLDSAGVNLLFNPEWMYIPVPFTYNNTLTNVARAEVDTSFDTLTLTVPVKIIHTVTDVFLADGYGTLQLPSGSFANTLRIQDKQVAVDSFTYLNPLTSQWTLYGTPTPVQSYNYRWVRDNGPDAFLLEIRADSAGTTATRSEYEVASIIHVPEITPEQVHVQAYPNPSAGVINVDFGASKGISGTATIYNSMGEVVRTSAFSDINRLTMYVNTLSNGLYHFSINSSDNKIREGSFMIQH